MIANDTYKYEFMGTIGCKFFTNQKTCIISVILVIDLINMKVILTCVSCVSRAQDLPEGPDIIKKVRFLRLFTRSYLLLTSR